MCPGYPTPHATTPAVPTRSLAHNATKPTRLTPAPHTHLSRYHYLLLLLLLLAPLNTTQVQPFPVPVLPQEFSSKTACREVYDQCMQASRDCLAAVAGNEPGRLGCEAYRNDVCEEHTRVGCDQLPNGGGRIGEIPSLTTLLTVVPIVGTTRGVQTTTLAKTSKMPVEMPGMTDGQMPTPDTRDPTTTQDIARTDVPVVITTTTTAPKQ